MFSQGPLRPYRGSTPVLGRRTSGTDRGRSPMSTSLREGTIWAMETAATTMSPRRWVRRCDHRLFAGVAGGIADATGTKALWWRLAFVFMAFTGGLGVLVYLLLWWF